MTTPNIEPLLTIPETAAVLRLSRSGVYRLLQSGALPTVRLMGSVRVRPSDLARLIEASTQSAHSGGEMQGDSAAA